MNWIFGFGAIIFLIWASFWDNVGLSSIGLACVYLAVH